MRFWGNIQKNPARLDGGSIWTWFGTLLKKINVCCDITKSHCGPDDLF